MRANRASGGRRRIGAGSRPTDWTSSSAGVRDAARDRRYVRVGGRPARRRARHGERDRWPGRRRPDPRGSGAPRRRARRRGAGRRLSSSSGSDRHGDAPLRTRSTGRRRGGRPRSGRGARAGRPGAPRPGRRRRGRRARAPAGPPPHGRAGPRAGGSAAGVRRMVPGLRRSASERARGRAVDSDRPSSSSSPRPVHPGNPPSAARSGPEVPCDGSALGGAQAPRVGRTGRPIVRRTTSITSST